MSHKFYLPGLILQQQADHPLTPINPWTYLPAGMRDDGTAGHYDQIALRLTLPLLGKLSGTGNTAWVIFPALAGLAFFPLLAKECAKWIGDRKSAAYLTMAFATGWTGNHFFGDPGFGDGVAWFLLLLSVSSGVPAVIFLAVLMTAFTDERGLIATGGTFLFWAWNTPLLRPRSPREDSASQKLPAQQCGAVIAAWIFYFGIRYYLGQTYGLRHGKSLVLDPSIFLYQVTERYPYTVFSVFKGLWIWVLLGLLALLITRRWLAAAGYAAVAGALLTVSLVVLDLERTLSYGLIMFPLAWRTEALSLDKTLGVSRFCFLVGMLFFVPWETPLHLLRFLLP